MNQTLPMQASKSPRYTTWEVAWRAIRVLGATISRVVLAFVTFWNIPVLGGDQTRQSQSFRTNHYI
jgi:hypothetical protein